MCVCVFVGVYVCDQDFVEVCVCVFIGVYVCD